MGSSTSRNLSGPLERQRSLLKISQLQSGGHALSSLFLRQGPWPTAGGVGSVWQAEAGCVVPWLRDDAAAGAAPVSVRFPASGWV